MSDYSELKRLAEDAKRQGNEWFAPYDLPLHSIIDARYIVAANPDVVLELIADNELLESDRADLWRVKRDAEATCDTKSAVIAELKAEIKSLRTAAEKVIEMNRQHAEDQYGEPDKAESWSCVTVLRAAMSKESGQ